jgi:chromosome segregation ATPase
MFVSPGSKAEVTVFLRNKGEKAYKHEVFGDKIIVVRAITSKSASSYKIKSAAGKVISTAKGELDAICDYLDIRVDNPVTILTQGSLLSLQHFTSPSSNQFILIIRGC